MKENLKFSDYPFIVPTVKRTINKLESLIQDLKECGSEHTASLAIKHWNKYMDELQTEIGVIYVLYTLESNNKAYKRANDQVDELVPLINKYATDFQKILAKARYKKDLEKKLGKFYFKKIDFSLRSFDEKILQDCIEENKLVSKYGEIMGTAQIPFRDKVLNLSELGKYTQDTDRDTRKEAATALDKWLGEHNQELGDLYSQLVTLRDGMAKKLGFKNYIELGYLRMGRYDYNPKMVANYRKQIEDVVVPLCKKLYKAQAKGLGIKNPQYYDYNVAFKTGNPVPAGDEAYLVKAAKKMYHSLSKESGEFFDFMVSHELLDLTARAGKQPGGYCTFFPKYGAPFIFSNFNGTSGDVDVLTHEGGHAFQAYMCQDFKIPEYREATMESCEIHSMSMEFFAWPYMKDFFGKDDTKYRYKHLSSCIEFLPYGVCVDHFQHWVYEHPKATHEERCAQWKELESRYNPERVFDGLPTLNNGTYWLRQGHIFNSPFYYIDYTLAQVVAFQFLLTDQKDHAKAWKKYVKLVKCGGKYPFCELLEHNKLRNPFEEGTIKKVITGCEKILKGIDTSKF